MFWENVPYWISLRRMEGLRRVEISQHLDLGVSWICAVILSSLLMVMHLQVHHSSLNCFWLRKTKSYLSSETSSFSICIPLIFKELSGSLFDFQDYCNKMRKTWSLYRTEMHTLARLQQRIPACSLQLTLVTSSPQYSCNWITLVCASIFICHLSVYLMSCIYACTYVCMDVCVHVCICVHMYMCVLACGGPRLIAGVIPRCYQH